TMIGGICGSDSRDKKEEVTVIPLVSCSRDIAKHLGSLTSLAFSGPRNEVDLILFRTAIFKIPQDINDMTICPFHRGKLGLGWTRGASIRCRVLPVLSQHGNKNKKSWPKGERGLGIYDFLHMLRKTGVFIQCGS
ncbi:Hypothetical predicted protein, partial [Paramuricea clavata]